ncbi:OsmC family protein [Paraburkholderia sp. J10-1]|uniref:OsmC family protein n=1 Tax=Paraburkholderia sp. J10-1 TaxID=2805430 RepID=UPI002AB61FB5|nr:OsmC family protein [Paraburkholderia sp. J10-1]
MVKAMRRGEPYCVAVSNGRVELHADTHKNGQGGAAGMRPHELLESALAACVCISIEMAAARAGVSVPKPTVEVHVERSDEATCFRVAVHCEAPLAEAAREIVLAAVAQSPVAQTLGRAVRVELGAVGADM